jgi:hypothetical protein
MPKREDPRQDFVSVYRPVRAKIHERRVEAVLLFSALMQLMQRKWNNFGLTLAIEQVRICQAPISCGVGLISHIT